MSCQLITESWLYTFMCAHLLWMGQLGTSLSEWVWSQRVLILVASPSLNRTLPLSGSNCVSCQTSTYL